MQSAQSETEARLLKDLAQSWVRIANQIERYQQFASSAPTSSLEFCQEPPSA
jgi:hypothetical protein